MCKKYLAELAQRGVDAVEHSDTTWEEGLDDSLEHARWMLEQMIAGTNPKLSDPATFNRWLGFVQGVLWTGGVRSIQELRDETRGKVLPSAKECPGCGVSTFYQHTRQCMEAHNG